MCFWGCGGLLYIQTGVNTLCTSWTMPVGSKSKAAQWKRRGWGWVEGSYRNRMRDRQKHWAPDNEQTEPDLQSMLVFCFSTDVTKVWKNKNYFYVTKNVWFWTNRTNFFQIHLFTLSHENLITLCTHVLYLCAYVCVSFLFSSLTLLHCIQYYNTVTAYIYICCYCIVVYCINSNNDWSHCVSKANNNV